MKKWKIGKLSLPVGLPAEGTQAGRKAKRNPVPKFRDREWKSGKVEKWKVERSENPLLRENVEEFAKIPPWREKMDKWNNVLNQHR